MIQPKLIDSGEGYENAGILHLVHIPDTPPPHPTVIMLQGRKGNEEVMWVFAKTLPKNCLIVAPRAIAAEDDGFSWYPFQSELPNMANFDAGMARLNKMIQALPALYGADLDQLYLMGFSQGAAMSFAYGMKNAGKIKAIASLVGFVPLDGDDFTYDLPLNNLPVFMAVGQKDDRVPLELAQRSAQILLNAGADLHYEEYNTGHKLNAQGTRDLKAWWAERSFGD
jgi:phospholipase/carboxylesterase